MQTKKKILNFKSFFSAIFVLLLVTSCGPTSTPTGTPTTENPTSTPTEAPTTSPLPEGAINFDIYTLNDFHGATKYVEDKYPQLGLAKYSTLFNSFAEQNTSFFISSGDMWQETIESNSNYGEFVTIAFNKIGLDAMTLGNHEFDWGPEVIIKNAEVADYPFLGANIIHTETGEYMENVEPSTIVEKDGLKVGIIGTIGPAQYNSITLPYVYEYEFVSEYQVVVDEANKLREQGADVVILSAHDGYGSSDFGILKKDMIDDAKIDMVVAGHTHQKQCFTYERSDGQQVPIIQAYSNGTAFGHVNFTYDTEFKTLDLNEYEVISSTDYADIEEDREILDLYNNEYNVDNLKAEVLGEATGDFSETKMAILSSTAIYEALHADEKWKEYDIVTAFHNSSRNELKKGEITYEDLFLSIPFDNEIVIFDVSSNYIQRSYYYTHSGYTHEDFSGRKYVAAIDYVAYKTIEVDEGIRTGLFARDIVKEYIKNKKVVTPSDYFNN